ncbi:MAG: GDP-mannose 4,6-dehydratase [Rhizobiales bacterium]|nr:GDP-mannose 4,6-dehydratase [Hyphomicrobiales bacterium]
MSRTRVLITGASGFVGFHLPQALARVCGESVEIVATSKDPGSQGTHGAIEALDVLNSAAIADMIGRHQPTHIVHLAGIAAPSVANADARMSWDLHLGSALNLGEAILAHAPDCWLLHVGTGMVYGETARSGQALREDALLAPLDEYGASKAAADLALGGMVRRGLRSIRFRPFNHSGPGQGDAFVLPSFARQVARIEAGLAPPVLKVGNLDAERDFLHVADVVDAYARTVQRTASLEPGTIFNIASGLPRRIGSILEDLLIRCRVKIDVEQDRARMRPSDIPCIIGNADRAGTALEWAPRHSFDDIVADVLNDWRERIASGHGETVLSPAENSKKSMSRPE